MFSSILLASAASLAFGAAVQPISTDPMTGDLNKDCGDVFNACIDIIKLTTDGTCLNRTTGVTKDQEPECLCRFSYHKEACYDNCQFQGVILPEAKDAQDKVKKETKKLCPKDYDQGKKAPWDTLTYAPAGPTSTPSDPTSTSDTKPTDAASSGSSSATTSPSPDKSVDPNPSDKGDKGNSALGNKAPLLAGIVAVFAAMAL